MSGSDLTNKAAASAPSEDVTSFRTERTASCLRHRATVHNGAFSTHVRAVAG
jgi:hypothetical protein